MNALAKVPATQQPPQKMSILKEIATRYNMEPKTFADTISATVFPKEGSNEEFLAFLVVAHEHGLNPLTKEIYAFPKRGGGIVPIVSVDGWCNLINSHPKFNGVEFDDHLDDKGNVTSITARIWRKDREKPIVVTEYLAECNRGTEPWKQYPRRMLRHKALIQCARYAFGFAGFVDPDEAERHGVDVSAMRNVTPVSADPPSPDEIDTDATLELVAAGRHEPETVEWGDAEPPAPEGDDVGEVPLSMARDPARIKSGLLGLIARLESPNDVLALMRDKQFVDANAKLPEPDQGEVSLAMMRKQTQLQQDARK